jgi:hypothetical protein
MHAKKNQVYPIWFQLCKFLHKDKDAFKDQLANVSPDPKTPPSSWAIPKLQSDFPFVSRTTVTGTSTGGRTGQTSRRRLRLRPRAQPGTVRWPLPALRRRLRPPSCCRPSVYPPPPRPCPRGAASRGGRHEAPWLLLALSHLHDRWTDRQSIAREAHKNAWSVQGLWSTV